MEPLYVGQVPVGLGTPDYYCTIEREGEPYLLFYVYGGGGSDLADGKIWHGWAVLGFGVFVYFISLETQTQIFLDLGYFYSLYPTEDYMLVTSAWSVFCYDKDAHQLWQTRSSDLAWLGIQITSVQDDRVLAIGEWPPFDEPAGQIPFTLSLPTGAVINE